MKPAYFLFCTVLMSGIICCNRKPFAVTNKIYKKQAKEFSKIIRQAPLTDTIAGIASWVGTTHFNLRKPNFVIILHTAQNTCDQTLKTFTNSKTEVSAHYLICRDGSIHHLLNDYLRAWHGGVAKWGNLTDINSSSIGIELDNNGNEPFSEPQINSLLRLLQALKKGYNIPNANFIGHADIAPTRKVDPSRYFPWKQLAGSGFGLWYGDTTNIKLPEHFNSTETLRIIGYDTRDSMAAFHAFRLHFLQDSASIMDEPAKKILCSLYQQYRFL
jgi:N-acetylmuramoyl-L-alanine amidase